MGPNPADRKRRPHWIAVVLIAVLTLTALQSSAHLGLISFPGTHATPQLTSAVVSLTVKVVRTGPSEASVLGIALTTSDVIALLVNGASIATTSPLWNLDYWFLHVPVSDSSTVQTVIGTAVSPVVTVPAYVPQPVGPPGFIYASGPNLMVNGSAIHLFGVDDQYPFIYALMASGLWGAPANPSYWGTNGLFPSGPDGHITNVSDANSFWREYFRYFLHYENVSSEPYYPRPNLLRVWVADDTWYPDGTYNAWQSNPTTFWAVFDAMVYWAGRAGIYLVPVIGHFSDPKDNTFFDTSSTHFAHQVAVARAIVGRYNNNPTIAMWDLWNEPDVNDDTYWASVGGMTGFKAWAGTYLADVKSASSNHLLTMGIGGWTLFPGVPSFGWQYFFFFNDIPGLEVTSFHGYGTAQDQYLIDWETGWHQAIGRPHFEGEFGYNAYPGPSALGYGYWPWYAAATRADGWPAIATMVFVDNGKGPYADYPYSGTLPAYPSAGNTSSPPPPPPPPPGPGGNTTGGNATGVPAAVTDLRVVAVNQSAATLEWTAPGADGMTGTATWYDFRYATTGPITESNFYAATHYELPFFPSPPGTTENVTIPGFQPSTAYWFALKTANAAGNWSTVSNDPSATTASLPASDTTPPSVGFLAPANGATVSGTVQVSAWATDNVGVTSVSLYLGQTLLGTLSAPPYVWTWQTSSVKVAKYTLTALATDAAGNDGSAAITVRVKNSPRILSVTWSSATSSVNIQFSSPMNRSSVETNAWTDPLLTYSARWTNDTTVALVLAGPMAPGQAYTLTIDANATDAEGVPLAGGVTFEFMPVPPPFPWAAGLTIMVALLAIVTGLIVARRHRRKPSLAEKGVRRAARTATPRTRAPSSVPRQQRTDRAASAASAGSSEYPRRPEAEPADVARYAAWLDGIEAEIATMGGASEGSDLDGSSATLDERRLSRSPQRVAPRGRHGR